MLVPLLMTMSALAASPAAPEATIVATRQEIASEFTSYERLAVTAFSRSVEDYVALHRRLAMLTPRLQVTADPVQLRHAIDALSEEIRIVRRDARMGDIFTPAVSAMFRQRIHWALWDADVTLLMEEMEGDDEPCAPRAVVNGRFPWNSGNAMWPHVLAVLPRLPAELEYRFQGADLVLIDIPANLVVDVLEGALIGMS